MRFASQKQTHKKNQMEISHISHTAKGHTWPYMINLSSEMFHSPRTVNNFIADWNHFYLCIEPQTSFILFKINRLRDEPSTCGLKG